MGIIGDFNHEQVMLSIRSHEAKSADVTYLLKYVAELEQKMIPVNKRGYDIDENASFDIGKLVVELWKHADTDDETTISLGEIISLYPRCKA